MKKLTLLFQVCLTQWKKQTFIFFLWAMLFPLLVFSQDPTCDVLQLEEMQGEVRFLATTNSETPLSENVSQEENRESIASVGDDVRWGDRLEVGPDSWVDLRFCDGSVIRLSENSSFQYLNPDPEETNGWVRWSFEKFKGSLRALMSGNGEQVKLRIKTPTAALGVRGTEFFLEVDEEESRLYTVEGAVLWGQRQQWSDLQTKQIKNFKKFLEVKKDLYSSSKKGRKLGPASRFDRSVFQKKRLQFLNQKKLERSQGFRSALMGKRNEKIFQRNRPILERKMLRRENSPRNPQKNPRGGGVKKQDNPKVLPNRSPSPRGMPRGNR